MIQFKFDAKPMEEWLRQVDATVVKAAALALNRTAAAVRTDIMRKLPSIFEHHSPATERSILYTPAKEADGIAKMQASVYVRDEGRGKSNPPQRWLRAEIDGGPRHDKRSERALKNTGLMQMGQQWTMPRGMEGPISGPQMVQILSQVQGFGEQGYRANATAATTRRLKKKDIAVTRKTGMQFFVAHDKRSGEPIGIYQLVGRGRVQKVLWFVGKRPEYRVRFRFAALAAEAAARSFLPEMRRALAEAARAGGVSSRPG